MADTRGIINYRITVDPSPARIAKELGLKARELSDYSDAWRELAPQMAASVRENIATRGASLGKPWPAPDREYVERKARNGRGRADLVLTGMLQRFATSPELGTIMAKPKAFAFGVRSLDYARAVQFGRTGRSRGRSFIGWSPFAKRAAEVAISNSVRAKFARLASALEGSASGR